MGHSALHFLRPSSSSLLAFLFQLSSLSNVLSALAVTLSDSDNRILMATIGKDVGDPRDDRKRARKSVNCLTDCHPDRSYHSTSSSSLDSLYYDLQRTFWLFRNRMRRRRRQSKETFLVPNVCVSHDVRACVANAAD